MELSKELQEEILELFSKRYSAVSKIFMNPDTDGFIKVAAMEECKRVGKLWRNFEIFCEKANVI